MKRRGTTLGLLVLVVGTALPAAALAAPRSPLTICSDEERGQELVRRLDGWMSTARLSLKALAACDGGGGAYLGRFVVQGPHLIFELVNPEGGVLEQRIPWLAPTAAPLEEAEEGGKLPQLSLVLESLLAEDRLGLAVVPAPPTPPHAAPERSEERLRAQQAPAATPPAHDGASDDGASDDAASDDAASDDGASDDGASDDAVSGDAVSDDTASDDTASDDGASDDTASDDGTSDDGASDDATSDDGASDDAASDDGASDDATSDDATSDDATSDDGASDDPTSDVEEPLRFGAPSARWPWEVDAYWGVRFRTPLAVSPELGLGASLGPIYLSWGIQPPSVWNLGPHPVDVGGIAVGAGVQHSSRTAVGEVRLRLGVAADRLMVQRRHLPWAEVHGYWDAGATLGVELRRPMFGGMAGVGFEGGGMPTSRVIRLPEGDRAVLGAAWGRLVVRLGFGE